MDLEENAVEQIHALPEGVHGADTGHEHRAALCSLPAGVIGLNFGVEEGEGLVEANSDAGNVDFGVDEEPASNDRDF